MQTTENLGLRKPEASDLYNVDDMNHNADVLDAEIQKIKDASDPEALNTHKNDKENPHGVTKEQIGLGNVPNVATNDQTPIYTVPSEASELTSGEKLSVAFGKIAKAVSSLISHLADTVKHITSAERANWNAASNDRHSHSNKATLDEITAAYTSAEKTKLSGIATGAEVNVQSDWNVTDTSSDEYIKNKPSSFTPAAHNQAASTISAGTLAGKVQANATAMATLTSAQVRDAVIKDSVTEGGTATESNGTIVFSKS